MIDRDKMQKLLGPLFPGLMGVALEELSPERVLASMDVRPDLCTAGGRLSTVPTAPSVSANAM